MKQQKVEAILMATNKPSYIHLGRDGKYYTTPNLCKSVVDTDFDLIIISDEEIQEGELTIHPTGQIVVVTHVFDEGYNVTTPEWYKEEPNKGEFWLRKEDYKGKIVSSKDESLGLPAPDNNSIQYIIDEFNSGKTEVYGVVDYYIAVDATWSLLVTNPDNTISIKPIEESWDDVFKEYWNQCASSNRIEDWLKQNYSVPTKLK